MTGITNEAGQPDFAANGSATTHNNLNSTAGDHSSCVIFGRAMNGWTDMHGAASQRSDPKVGDAADFPQGFGPQGDAVRILNQMRLVREAQ